MERFYEIVFLQNTIDTQGGIIIVNKTLGQAFLENGDEVYYVSLRRGVVHSEITYPKNAKNILINHKAIWDTPRLISAVNAFRKGKIFSGASIIAKRFFYDIGLRKDFRKCAKLLTSINPDIIICSHYELLDCNPKNCSVDPLIIFITRLSMFYFFVVIENSFCAIRIASVNLFGLPCFL